MCASLSSFLLWWLLSGRTFTFSYIFAFVNIEFGLKYFGLLCGIIMLFTGLMNLLLNVIDAFIASGDLTIDQVQYMQLGVYIVSFYFPIYLFASTGCKGKCQKTRRVSINTNTSSNRPTTTSTATTTTTATAETTGDAETTSATAAATETETETTTTTTTDAETAQ